MSDWSATETSAPGYQYAHVYTWDSSRSIWVWTDRVRRYPGEGLQDLADSAVQNSPALAKGDHSFLLRLDDEIKEFTVETNPRAIAAVGA